MSLTIEHITCPSGDYEVVLINGSVDYAGNSIPTFYWIDLLKSFGFTVRSTEVSDEQMIEGKYFNE